MMTEAAAKSVSIQELAPIITQTVKAGGTAELTVTAQNWARTDDAVTLTPEGSGDFYALELLPYSAHYTAEALFMCGTDVGDQVYRMRYEFDVELPEQ